MGRYMHIFLCDICASKYSCVRYWPQVKITILSLNVLPRRQQKHTNSNKIECVVVCDCNCAYYAQMRALVTAIRLWRESEVLSPQLNIPANTYVYVYKHLCLPTRLAGHNLNIGSFVVKLVTVTGGKGVGDFVMRLHGRDKNFVGNCCCSCCWCYCCSCCIIATRCRTDVRLPTASANVDSTAMCTLARVRTASIQLLSENVKVVTKAITTITIAKAKRQQQTVALSNKNN